MMSRIPPVSPASIMLVVRSSNTLGYRRMALASVAPPSTVVRTPVSVFWKLGFSWLAARISRHCTSGKPASIMTENCRKNTAMSFVLTLELPKVGMENSLPFSRMDPGVMRSRRSAEASDSLLGATRSPWTFSPLLVFPENVKTGMVLFSSLLLFLLSIKAAGLPASYPHRPGPVSGHSSSSLGWRRCPGHRRSGRRRPVQQVGAARNHLRQFVLVTGSRHSHFHRDLFLVISAG